MKTLGHACLLLLTLGTIHCGKKQTTAPRPPIAKVTVNFNRSLGYAPMIIAKEEGFFTREGIDAHFVELDSNSAIVATAAGTLDVLLVGMRAGVFNLMLKNVPVAVVADRGHSSSRPCQSSALITTAAAADRIAAHHGDPRGERVALIPGGIAEQMTMRYLETHGRTLDDVEVIRTGQSSGGSSPGEINGIQYLSEPSVTIALTAGWAKIVAAADDLLPGHEMSVMVYGKRLLHDDPELGRRFMSAYLRGVRQYNQGKTDRNVEILSRYTKQTPKILRKACWTAFESDGHIDASRVQPFLDWALARHYLDAPIARERWWNPTFIDAANARLDGKKR